MYEKRKSWTTVLPKDCQQHVNSMRFEITLWCQCDKRFSVRRTELLEQCIRRQIDSFMDQMTTCLNKKLRYREEFSTSVVMPSFYS